MPSSPAPLRNSIAELVRFADRDLSALWRDVSNAAQARVALMDVMPALVETYGSAAATLAATWYDQAREKAGVARRFTAIPAEITDRGARSLVGWATDTSTDMAALQALILGGLQRRIADHSRLTIMGSSIADPSAQGWQRETDGNGCAFCEMLAGRGAVYSEEGADFASHDVCGCSAVPAFEGETRPVKKYTPSARNITGADRARVRSYIASH